MIVVMVWYCWNLSSPQNPFDHLTVDHQFADRLPVDHQFADRLPVDHPHADHLPLYRHDLDLFVLEFSQTCPSQTLNLELVLDLVHGFDLSLGLSLCLFHGLSLGHGLDLDLDLAVVLFLALYLGHYDHIFSESVTLTVLLTMTFAFESVMKALVFLKRSLLYSFSEQASAQS